MRPDLQAQCSDLMLALQGIRKDLDPLSFLSAARGIVEGHMQAAFDLGRGSLLKNTTAEVVPTVGARDAGHARAVETDAGFPSSRLQEPPAPDLASRPRSAPAMQPDLFGGPSRLMRDPG